MYNIFDIILKDLINKILLKKGPIYMSEHTRVLSAYNLKGGSSKTTSVTSLAYVLGNLGKKVLLIDFDPQANASENLGFDINSEFVCFGHLIEEYATVGSISDLGQVVNLIQQPTYLKNVQVKGKFGYTEKEIAFPFYVLPISRASKAMIRVENSLVPSQNFVHKHSEQVAFYLLKPFIKMMKEQLDFDYILIDTNPSLSLLSMNAIISSDYLIMPTFLGNEGVAGASAVYEIIEEVQLNAPDFVNLGVVIQRYNPRRNLDKFLCDELEESDIPVFQTRIPDAFNRVNDATARGKLIVQVDKKIEKAYEDLAKEIMNRIQEIESER